MTTRYTRRTISTPNPSVADVLARFRQVVPEFTASEFPDATVMEWITQAKQIYNWRILGVVYLTAHLIALWRDEQTTNNEPAPIDSGFSSQVQSQRVGPLSVTYRSGQGDLNRGSAGAQESLQFYDRSRYGRMYLEIKNATAGIKMPRVFG